MKNKVKIILFLMISLFVFPFATKEVYAYENIDYEQKIYCEINEEYDFALDSVLVMIDKNLSDVNKVFEKSFFNDIDIKEIVDLTYKNNWDSSVDTKEEDFRQILELFVYANSKEIIISIVNELEEIEGIVCASPNYIGRTGIEVDDADFTEQWGLHGTYGIDILEAWDFVVGNEDVQVGILDTGITPHNDLNENLEVGFSYIDNNTNDYETHGSHVAGIVGAVGNSIGVSGVCRNVSLVPLKFDGDIGDVQSALIDAEENNIKIVNMSWWNFPNSPILKNAINDYDGLFVCIAGNGNTNIDNIPNYPASYHLENMIVVGAINENGVRRSTSNFGLNTVDIYAPGGDILSTIPINSYDSYGGTSMAAPHVAGVAALLLSIDENLTTAQIREAILQSAIPLTINIGGSSTQDVIRLNAYNAVKYVLSNYSETMTLNYDTKSLSQSVDSSSAFFNEKNYFLKLDVNNPFEYDFTISSSNLMEITLYDSSFTEIDITITQTNGGLTNQFAHYLSYGLYYLKVNFTNENANGVITTTIVGEHYHSPSLWMYYSRISHRGRCSCGEWVEKPHVVNISEVVNYQAECLECHAMLDLRYDVATGGINNRKVSINGSYILPNGIIVLVEEDIEAYFAGTLIFYDEDETLVTQ
ncbi:MAG: hypothetical protein E7180_05935 [Erysipelotrichaceae bacterium]|nr:hypothetical protein [Erysipelotrichaceae bacterium]